MQAMRYTALLYEQRQLQNAFAEQRERTTGVEASEMSDLQRRPGGQSETRAKSGQGTNGAG